MLGTRPPCALASGVANVPDLLPTQPPLVTRVTAATILLFWAAQFALLTAQRMVMVDDSASFLVPRVIVTLVGIALSFAIARIHAFTRGRSVVAAAAAFVGAALHAAANFGIFHLFMPDKSFAQGAMTAYVFAVLQWFWAYTALSALLLSVVYATELGERERRVAQLQREAHAAQMRVLRYQLNPHFMFNTLNSVASLVAARRVDDAERMVENLSDFLRAGLALDPNDDIPLAREIELQRLYLDIEAVRFSDRLRVTIDVPESLRDVRVPSLITQPLIENAVRHAVASSTTPVALTIAAREEGSRVAIEVRDDGGSGPAGGKGTGVGLGNVRERLTARFGEPCDFAAGPQPGGGYAVRFTVPRVDGGE
jgi:two-component system, LytTR family, sensor kinase